MNYILGAGITGLIAGYFNKSYKIIGLPNVSQDSQSFPLGPRFLHFSNATEELLKSLKLKTSTKIIKIGYYYNDSLHKNISEKLKIEYFKKTRGNSEIFNSSMSSGKTEIKVFKVTPEDLYDSLFSTLIARDKNFLIIDTIVHINLKEKTLYTDYDCSFEYKKLISTIPASTFFNLIGKPLISAMFQAKLKHFHLIEKIIDLDSFNYVYFPEKNNPITRITNYKDKQIVEAGRKLESECDKIKLIKHIVLPGAQIIRKINFKNPAGIEFVGRYATWNHSKKIGEVIEYAKNLCN